MRAVLLVGVGSPDLDRFAEAATFEGFRVERADGADAAAAQQRIAADVAVFDAASFPVEALARVVASMRRLGDRAPRALLGISSRAEHDATFVTCGFDDVVASPLSRDRARVHVRLAARVADLAQRDALRDESDENLRVALRAARLATWDWDVRRGTVEWSEGAHEVLGLGEDERVGTFAESLERVHPDDRAAVERNISRALHEGAPFDVEHRVRTRDGEPRWIQSTGVVLRDATGAAVRVRGSVIDVTSRKIAELSLRRAYEELRESDERFRIVARATSDAVWDWDLSTDEVRWNENMAKLFGHAAPVTHISWWEETMHPEDRVRVSEGIRSVVELGEDHWEDEYRFRRADGTWANVYDRGVVIRDDAGKSVRMIGAMMDITERRELQARLLLADRMASVGTLAAGVAHEINNPLAYVIANVDLAAAELRKLRVPQLARATELLAEAKEGAERVRRIVHDLKTFSRADDAMRERVDLRKVVESSINLAMNEIRHRARLVRELDDVPRIDANAGRLGQVVVNLLVNAAQAIPEGAADRNEIRVSTRTDDAGNAVLEVRDTGPGMPPDIVHRIFDPFYTTKPHGEGTGLGLTICHGIVSGLGGRIEVESEVGSGSLFRVILPRARNDMAPRPSPAAPITTEPRRCKVLVVDDEPMIGKAVQLTLEEIHDVTPLTSAREALERITRGERWDAIVCDLMMPEMTGMELHERLLRIAPDLARRMIFLTGGAFTARARTFLASVPNPRLEKPFEPEVLREAIAQVVRAAKRDSDDDFARA